MSRKFKVGQRVFYSVTTLVDDSIYRIDNLVDDGEPSKTLEQPLYRIVKVTSTSQPKTETVSEDALNPIPFKTITFFQVDLAEISPSYLCISSWSAFDPEVIDKEGRRNRYIFRVMEDRWPQARQLLIQNKIVFYEED